MLISANSMLFFVAEGLMLDTTCQRICEKQHSCWWPCFIHQLYG